MNNILAVFGNRNHTMQFASYMRKSGKFCKIIDTPRDISKACGISIVFSNRDLTVARFILNRFQLSSFNGMYEIHENGIFRNYRRI